MKFRAVWKRILPAKQSLKPKSTGMTHKAKDPKVPPATQTELVKLFGADLKAHETLDAGMDHDQRSQS